MDNSHTHKRSASVVEGLQEQGSAQKPKLRLASDLWSEDEHRTLDQEILKACGELPQNSRHAILLLPILLHQLLDQVRMKTTAIDSTDTLDLVLKNDALMDALLDSWSKKSFKIIRNHGEYHMKVNCFRVSSLFYFSDPSSVSTGRGCYF